VVRADEAMVSIFQIRLKSNDGLLSDVFDLLKQIPRIFFFVHQRLKN
jgi:hypothetical protein